MGAVVSYVLVTLASLLAIPVAVIVLEVVAAVIRPRRKRFPRASPGVRLRVAVLVPAHNESTGLLPTIEDIKAQLCPGDRLLVVADNCSDDTAAIAAAAGADVIGRDEPDRIGKGYALNWGLRHLSTDPPDIVIIIDADCRLANDTINRLSTACALTRRPVQALNLMTAPDQSLINYQIAEFAWRLKNWVRPLGLAALNLPCQLTGTGMAFSWDAIRSAKLASGHIVEDLKLGLDLAAAGYPPVFCPSARVSSQFASTAGGADSQRRRWEQGHIYTIVSAAPRLLRQAIARRDWGLLALTLDLAVPPLSLLAMLVLAMFAVTGMAALLGLPSAAFFVSTASLLIFLLAAGLAWLKCGRDVLPARAVWSIAPYVLGKVGLYRRIFSDRSDVQWIRTDRTKSG